MSLERELVFKLRDEGNSETDVYEIVKTMADPNGHGRAVTTDSKKIEVALSQYEARELLENRGNYIKQSRKETKKEKKKILQEAISNAEDNYMNLYGKPGKSSFAFRVPCCKSCGQSHRTRFTYLSKSYLDYSTKIPAIKVDLEFLFQYSRKCGSLRLEDD